MHHWCQGPVALGQALLHTTTESLHQPLPLHLPDEAPPLPVPECTSSNCKCRYVHYDDRRQDDADRRGIVGLRNELYSHSGEADRRTKSRGRRDSDYS